MRKPIDLKQGDKVAVLSTAKFISSDSISNAVSWLKNHGFEPVIGQTIDEKYYIYAGSDDLRLNDFQSFLDDDTIKAIWFAKGGYGALRILDRVIWDKFVLNPKWLIGFSDMTNWHNQVNQFFAIQSMHAIMPSTFDNNSDTSKHMLIDSLQGKRIPIEFPKSHKNVHEKVVEGEIIGGNLAIMYSLLGTNTGWNTKGKILFFEEVDEYLYQIDRMILAIKKAGKFNGIRALVIGAFTEIHDNEDDPFGSTYYDIILDHTKDMGFPIFFDIPVGHIENNMPLALGANVKITPHDESITLSYL